MRGDYYGDGNRYRGKTISDGDAQTIDLSNPTIDLPCARCGETATIWLSDAQYALKDGTMKIKTKCLCPACRENRQRYRDGQLARFRMIKQAR